LLQLLYLARQTLLILSSSASAGGAMAIFDFAELYMTQVTVSNSRSITTEGGGGIAIFDMTTAVFVDSIIEGSVVNNAGAGGIGALGPLSRHPHAKLGNASITISGCMIKSNVVPDQWGGGMHCQGSAHVLITNGTVFQNNTGAISMSMNCTVVITGGSKLVNNTAVAGAGGGALFISAGNVTVTGGSLIQGNKALTGPGGGGIYMVADSVVLLDSAQVMGNMAAIGAGVHVSGTSKLTIRGNTVVQNNTAPVGPDMLVGPVATLSLENTTFDLYRSDIMWQRTTCIPGEVLDQGSCRKCLPSTFSLVPGAQARCEVCPEHATCALGGDSIIPLAGYWHSHPYSTQIHRCPHLDGVCTGSSYTTCAAGYGGNLCGVCEPGYGSSTAFSCGRCTSPAVHWVLYLAAGLLAVLLVAFTVHSTWQDNQQQTAGPQQSVKPSDMIKVLILFLQHLVIVSSLSVPWPTALAYFFRVARFIFAATNGQLGSVSLDCMLSQSSSVPVSVQRQLIYLVAPVGILAGVVVLFAAKALAVKMRHALRRRSSSTSTGSGARPPLMSLGSMLLQKLPLMCIVTFFFAYPFLVRVSLGMFACLKLDVTSHASDPYPQFAVADASRGYWVHAMQQPCFEGWHLTWALALGVPGVVLFCVATPLALFIGLTLNKSKLQHADVKAHFGFLYRPYVEKRCWWEGLMTTQTMLLVLVSVFRYTLGGYYSVLLVTLLFTGMATLQLILKPFASRRLHVMQLIATGCLYLNGCIAQSLFSVDMDSSPVFKEVIGGVGVGINAAFLGWCCYCILAESRQSMGRVVRAMKRVCARCCANLCGSLSMSGSANSGSSLNSPKSMGTGISTESTTASDGDDGDHKSNQVLARVSPSKQPALPNV
jgi:hypothetical protein